MKTRLVSFDLLRGIIIILMIFINLFDETAQSKLLYSDTGTSIDIWVTALVPNIFMFLMGFFFILAGGFTPRKLLTKGLSILLLGYALNILRYPVIMYAADWYDTLAEALADNMYYIHMVDIYIFVGYACLLLIPFALLPRFFPLYFTLSAYIMYNADNIRGIKQVINLLPHALISYAKHLALPVGKNVYFPLFPWLCYIFLGIGCALLYQKYGKATFLKLAGLAGLLLSFVGYSIFFREYANAQFSMRADFYQHDYTLGTMLVGITLLAPVIAELLTSVIPDFISKLIIFGSKHVVTIYVVSWLITCWGKFVKNWQNSFALNELLIITLGIYLISLAAAKGLELLQNK